MDEIIASNYLIENPTNSAICNRNKYLDWFMPLFSMRFAWFDSIKQSISKVNQQLKFDVIDLLFWIFLVIFKSNLTVKFN